MTTKEKAEKLAEQCRHCDASNTEWIAGVCCLEELLAVAEAASDYINYLQSENLGTYGGHRKREKIAISVISLRTKLKEAGIEL